MTTGTDIERLSINTIRTLSMDAVQRAESGHPGAPMGLAPAAYVLWKRHLRVDPSNPGWPNRDRFVLSNGHASMLLYSLLHLAGFEEMTLEEIRQFRQWGSITPGHPEEHLTPGVETTTGPLGQGFANAVGMALAEARLNSEFDGVIDHHTYVFCSDGDVMEGISHEAASLAGHLNLGKLVYIYDDNQITIDGSTELAFSEDVEKRFQSYGWHTQHVAAENDLEAIDEAIERAKAEGNRPSLIGLETTIGYGSPQKADTSSAHGAPLGVEEIERTKDQLGWEFDEPFHVPAEVREHMDLTDDGKRLHGEWRRRLEQYADAKPERHAELRRRLDGELPAEWDGAFPEFDSSDGPMPTRNANGDVLDALYETLPELMGGSADLAGSNRTLNEDFGVIGPDSYEGQCIHFGIREHAMCGIANGLNLHGGVRAFGATFLVFSDYMRPSLRLAALMEQPTMMVFTHDSIGLGEDGPTHQPIEHLASLRAIPQMTVFRPTVAEVPDCWRTAIENLDGPSSLVFTRQGLPVIDRDSLDTVGGARRGAYILAEAPEGDVDLILLSTGSEVHLCIEARERLAQDGIGARVVSMPSWEVFEAQENAWIERVLPPEIETRLAVEAAAPLGWDRWVGDAGEVMGIDRFGASAPWEINYEKFGFTPNAIAERAREMLHGG